MGALSRRKVVQVIGSTESLGKTEAIHRLVSCTNIDIDCSQNHWQGHHYRAQGVKHSQNKLNYGEVGSRVKYLSWQSQEGLLAIYL